MIWLGIAIAGVATHVIRFLIYFINGRKAQQKGSILKTAFYVFIGGVLFYTHRNSITNQKGFFVGVLIILVLSSASTLYFVCKYAIRLKSHAKNARKLIESEHPCEEQIEKELKYLEMLLNEAPCGHFDILDYKDILRLISRLNKKKKVISNTDNNSCLGSVDYKKPLNRAEQINVIIYFYTATISTITLLWISFDVSYSRSVRYTLSFPFLLFLLGIATEWVFLGFQLMTRIFWRILLLIDIKPFSNYFSKVKTSDHSQKSESDSYYISEPCKFWTMLLCLIIYPGFTLLVLKYAPSKFEVTLSNVITPCSTVMTVFVSRISWFTSSESDIFKRFKEDIRAIKNTKEIIILAVLAFFSIKIALLYEVDFLKFLILTAIMFIIVVALTYRRFRKKKFQSLKQ